MTALADVGAREWSRRLQHYAKRFSAGAFAMPTAAEIARGDLRTWAAGEEWTAAFVRRLTRDSVRTDFTGTDYLLPRGSTVVTHLARSPAGPVPDLDEFDAVYAYREDAALSAALAAQGREVRATRISAASEIIACWGRAGEGRRVPPHDLVTVAEVPLDVDTALRRAAEAEVAGADGWHDDYPYYNRDGSWSAISLRGFDPADPTWGVKPAEMSKAWWAEHPEAAGMTCDWTVFAERVPALMAVIRSVPWWTRFERVRLLRMSARGGKGGKLLRHTDITDRSAGTRDGQVCRFHLPIVTHPDVRMMTWELDGRQVSTHLAPWRLYYLDQRKPHAVVNASPVDRVHLVVDVLADDAVRAALGAAT